MVSHIQFYVSLVLPHSHALPDQYYAFEIRDITIKDLKCFEHISSFPYLRNVSHLLQAIQWGKQSNEKVHSSQICSYFNCACYRQQQPINLPNSLSTVNIGSLYSCAYLKQTNYLSNPD